MVDNRAPISVRQHIVEIVSGTYAHGRVITHFADATLSNSFVFSFGQAGCAVHYQRDLYQSMDLWSSITATGTLALFAAITARGIPSSIGTFGVTSWLKGRMRGVTSALRQP
jgi:hypothetical protein